MTIFLLIPLIVLSIHIPVYAHNPDDNSLIHGFVIDPNKNIVVESATVTVANTKLYTITDDNGFFTIDKTAPGNITLVVEAENYETTTTDISDEERKSEVVLFVFSVQDSQYKVEVTAEKTTIADTTSTTYLTQREIKAAPRRNAEEVLRQVPGLMLTQHGSEGKGHQFFLRGFDAIHGSDLELLVEGMPVNEWSNIHAQGYIDLGFIIPEMIKEVSIVKGPFGPDQGAFAMAGSINYKLGVTTDELGLQTSYTIGTTNRHRIFAGYSPAHENGEQFIGIEAITDDGFGQKRAIKKATLNARLKRSNFSLLGLANHSQFDLPGSVRNDDVDSGFIGFYDAYDDKLEGTSTRTLLSLNYEREHTNATVYAGYRRLKLLENFTGFLINNIDGDRKRQFQETFSSGIFATHVLELLPSLNLTTNIGLRFDSFEQYEHNVGQNLELLSIRRDIYANQLITHAWGGLSWSPNSRLKINGGLRTDLVYVDVTDYVDRGQGDDILAVFSARASARLKLAKRLKLFAAYGQGFRPPEARAFTSFDEGRTGLSEEVFQSSNPDITTSHASEIGLQWYPSLLFGFSVAGFATFIDQESIFDHVSGLSLQLNGTRRLGAELIINSQPLSWLSLAFDVTAVDARFTSSNEQVPLAPPLMSSLKTYIKYKGFRSGLRFLWIAPRPLPSNATSSALFMSDATLGYHWDFLHLDLEIENILDLEPRRRRVQLC